MAKRRGTKRPGTRGGEARPAPERQPERSVAPNDASRSDPALSVPRPRPWWLAGLIVVVIAVVALTRFGEADRSAGQDVEDMNHDIDAPPAPPERMRVRVVQRFPHDTEAFTQGLLWHEGHLYESTGLAGRSTLRKVALETGEVLERRSLSPALFAEGLARVGDRLVQLTWRNHQAHVWSLDGFEHRRTFRYDGEGWGLCYDGEHLVMSDGSARLAFRDPETFRVVRRVTVRESGRPLEDLNELECVGGVVWANVWQTDRLVRIDPSSGRVTAVVDASGLLTDDERYDTDVLNGIAWIPERNRFVITGKLWPHLFEVELVPETTR